MKECEGENLLVKVQRKPKENNRNLMEKWQDQVVPYQ